MPDDTESMGVLAGAAPPKETEKEVDDGAK